MAILKNLIIVWAILSLIATIVLVDQRSYGGSTFYLVEHLLFPFGFTFTLAAVAYHKQWLDFGGAMVSMAVGLAHSASHLSLLCALLAFFVSSSCATSVGKRAKKRLDPTYKKGGQRNLVQVFSNGAVATTAALLYVLFSAPGTDGYESISFQEVQRPLLACVACMAALAGCCGDTWASEFGVLQGGGAPPRHVLTWRRVPAGTNGGVTLTGTACSVLGGLLVGTAFFLGLSLEHLRSGDLAALAATRWPAVPLGALAGFLCSLVDSVLGAALQYSGRDVAAGGCVVNRPGPGVEHVSGWDVLDNHAVNFLSSLITAILIPAFVYAVAGDPTSL